MLVAKPLILYIRNDTGHRNPNWTDIEKETNAVEKKSSDEIEAQPVHDDEHEHVILFILFE